MPRPDDVETIGVLATPEEVRARAVRVCHCGTQRTEQDPQLQTLVGGVLVASLVNGEVDRGFNSARVCRTCGATYCPRVTP